MASSDNSKASITMPKLLTYQNMSGQTTSLVKTLKMLPKTYANYLVIWRAYENIFFQGIIPKCSYQSFESIDYVNYWIHNHTCYSTQLNFINHKLFAQENEMNYEFYRKHTIHTNRKGLLQLVRDFMRAIRYRRC